MNRFLERLADLYAPLGRRGMLMDGQYRFASDSDNDTGAARGNRLGGRSATADQARPGQAAAGVASPNRSLVLRIAHPFHR
ncbi:hypothetical protein J2T07_001395 [Luteibacter jiangsuensis]|uniref:Uncharacterized protein n=1 Tax=Luteibacter jiangsuensis TaxID=637577 RepID=A0ABT9SY28_9GAMM|nr:hypothetical protein [Luteibacter jiangsuensis]MDQ0009218.1 hypothetical protein [Luteibacter jiangsuensis]